MLINTQLQSASAKKVTLGSLDKISNSPMSSGEIQKYSAKKKLNPNWDIRRVSINWLKLTRKEKTTFKQTMMMKTVLSLLTSASFIRPEIILY